MADPFDIVIFGGAGDLAFRKLVPALYRAYREEKLAPVRVLSLCVTSARTQQVMWRR